MEEDYRTEKLKAEVKGMADNCRVEIESAERRRTEAYNLPWGMGTAYIEESRDRATDLLHKAEREAVSYGKSIWTKYSHLDISQRRKLIETYIEAIGNCILEDQILEIKNCPQETTRDVRETPGK